MALITQNFGGATAGFGQLLYPGLRELWGVDYNDWPEEFSGLFEILTSSRNFEVDYSMTGLGLVPQKGEGQSVDFDTIYSGFSKTYIHLLYGLGFIVSREMFEDDLYNKINQMPKSLARSNKHTVEITAQNYFNNAFTISAKGPDGVALFSASHPLINGGTMSNMPSVAADLDVTSLEQATIDIALNWYDDRGLKLYARPMGLHVHPNNDWQCQQILKSAGLPDTANNNINPAQGILPNGHKMYHWFTNTTYWFLKTDVPKSTTFFWRRRPDFTQDTDHDSDNAKFKTTMRFCLGHTDHRGWYGVQGP